MASPQDYSSAIDPDYSAKQEKQTLSVWALTALVVGSMVGAGIFTLPGRFGRATGVVGALIAWLIAGVGMLMLAFVFQNLAQRKPNLDSGVFIYAKAGFGNYIGFLAALAFWSSTCVGNVSYFVLIKSTLGEFFPVFGDGDTVAAVIGSSIIIWLFHFMILRGVEQAAGLNTIVTIAKIVPILTFVFILLFAFNPEVFMGNLLGGQGYDEPLWQQVRDTMLVTVFVFIGIEGKLVRHILELLLPCPGEDLLNILVEVALIAFEAQDIVSTALDNLLGNGGLGAHSINGYETSLEV
jgi:arginine:ornithine antiporter/lysine permease